MIWMVLIVPNQLGSDPDLGADEINQTDSLVFTAEKLALAPALAGKPAGRLFQSVRNAFTTILIGSIMAHQICNSSHQCCGSGYTP